MARAGLSSSTELTGSSSSHALFASRLCSIRDQPTSALLDPSSGLALLFADVCRDKAQRAAEAAGLEAGGFVQGPREGEHGEGGDDDEEDPDAWSLEARTWELIHALFSERLLNSRKRGKARAITTGEGEDDEFGAARSNPYQTPLSTVQEVLDSDAALAELQVLREWLSSQLQPLHVVEVRKGYLPFTKNHLKAEKRLGQTGKASGGTPSKSGSGLANFGMALGGTSKGKGVTALDPDAANRGKGVLEMEDQAYDKAVHRTLFEYVRAGKLDAAIDLAGQIDQSWRAASLRGATLHWRPGLVVDDAEGGLDDEDDMHSSEPLGNRNRTLWKAVCRQVAGQARLDEYERALYGALCGDLGSVLAVSRDWESQLWAHVNSKLEDSIEESLHRSATWWSQGAELTFPDAKGETGAVVLNEMTLRPSNAGPAKASPDPASALKDIFARLAQVEQHGIHAQSNNPYRTVQRAVVLDELNDLLAHVESRLLDMRGSVDPRQYGRLVRFFAHLILFLRLLNLERPPPDLVCNGILRAYVEVLEFSGQDELVALYASSLEPESATQSYAHFLQLIDYTSSLEHRRGALAKAKEHDLDVAAVARTTVAMIFDETFPGIPSYVASQRQDGGVTDFEVSPEPIEERMIRAIDWLTFDESTHRDAMVQSNALLRLFLAAGRLHAARKLLEELPSDIVGRLTELDLSNDEAVEHVHFRSFFDALASHVRYAEVWSRRPPGEGNKEDASARSIVYNGLGRKDRASWTAALANVCQTAHKAIRQLLEMAWLKIEVEGDDLATERRLQELARIRQIYIPELVLRLHFMLYETREVLPSHLEALMTLPNLVADERHKLYLEFVTRDGNRLREYLGFVRQAALACVDRAGQDPFQLVQPTLRSVE